MFESMETKRRIDRLEKDLAVVSARVDELEKKTQRKKPNRQNIQGNWYSTKQLADKVGTTPASINSWRGYYLPQKLWPEAIPPENPTSEETVDAPIGYRYRQIHVQMYHCTQLLKSQGHGSDEIKKELLRRFLSEMGKEDADESTQAG